MTLNLFSDYSLRVLMYAAIREPKQFSVDEAARAYGLSRHHAAKVVNFLSKRGYLRCKRGRGGGVWLGKPAGEVRIGEVLRQTEGGPPLVECFDAGTNSCPLIHACVLKRALAEALAAFFNRMDRITLEQLVERPENLRRALDLRP